VGNQGGRQLGNQEAIMLKLDESPEQLDAPDEAISGNQWQSVAISGNHWQSPPPEQHDAPSPIGQTTRADHM
jgi:hypothetical protein